MSTTFDLLLLDGKVVLKINGQWTLEDTDIGVIGNKITQIGNLKSYSSRKKLNCKGLVILPGLIDSQVHLRQPGLEHKEDFNSGSRGAVLGGITSVFDMPNTKPSITNLETWNLKMKGANHNFWCDYAFYMGASINNISELSKLENLDGCCGTKIFMGSSTGDLLVDEIQGLKRILTNLKRNVAVHSEDESLLLQRTDKRIKGHPESHPDWRNEDVALTSTKKLIGLARELNKQVHVLHITTQEEMDFLKANKDICTVEVTPQHLTFTAPQVYEQIGTLAQMNPPIRNLRHQEALWKAINSGVVDVMGSDHAPHTLEEKAKEYPLSPSGMPGVQTMVPIMLDHVNKGRLSLFRLVELLAERPAEIFKLKNKGTIQNHRDADFTIVDLNKNWTITNSVMETKSGWTPFNGFKITGKPIHTVIRGQIVVEDEIITGYPVGSPLEFKDL